MTPLPADLGDLARYAIGQPWWRTMPGMRVREVAAPGMAHTDGRWIRVDEDWSDVGVWLPDLADGATIGCLLHRLREVEKWPEIGVAGNPRTGRWVALDRMSEASKEDYPTEAHALVAALDAAWGAR